MKPRFNIPFTKVESAQFAVSAPRCKNCREVQAHHTDDGACLFSPYRWIEGTPSMVVEPYNMDIRGIIADNSVKDMGEEEDAGFMAVIEATIATAKP